MKISITTPKRSPQVRYSSSRPTQKRLLNTSIPELRLDQLTTRASQKFASIFKSYKGSTKNTSTNRAIKESLINTSFDDPLKEFELLDLPVPAELVIEKFSRYLTQYEKKEITEFSKVYYLPFNIPKLLIKEDEGSVNFDDDLGNYNLIHGDALAYRFEVLEILGRGSFSQVCRCLDHKKNEIVAVKIIKNKKKFNAQASVEIRLLENVNNKDLEENSNIIHLKEHFSFRGHTCLIFEPLSMNLYELLKDNGFKGLSLVLIRKIAQQVLQSLKFLKSVHIIHCDLKPENILLRSSDSSAIKLIDLGSSCYEHERIFSYIQARFYRAPEIILGLPYSTSIDMWSFGCILAELYKASPLFPASNEVELISMILELKDLPPPELLNKALKRKVFFDRENRPRLVVNSKGKVTRPNSKKLEEVLKCSDTKFVEFILKWDPKKRMTPEEALRHEFIAEGLQKNFKKFKISRDSF